MPLQWQSDSESWQLQTLSLRIPVVVAVIQTLPAHGDMGWVTPLMEGLAVTHSPSGNTPTDTEHLNHSPHLLSQSGRQWSPPSLSITVLSSVF